MPTWIEGIVQGAWLTADTPTEVVRYVGDVFETVMRDLKRSGVLAEDIYELTEDEEYKEMAAVSDEVRRRLWAAADAGDALARRATVYTAQRYQMDERFGQPTWASTDRPRGMI